MQSKRIKMLDTKLLFLDIDGTLINHAKQITPRTKAAVSRVRKEHGVEVVLISARMPKSLAYLCSQLDIPINIVAFNGSICKLQLLGDRVIQLPSEQLLNHDLIVYCHEAAKDYDDMSINIYTEDQWLSNNTDRWTRREMNNTLVEPDVTNIASDNIQTHLTGKYVHKVLIRSNPENTNEVAAKLKSAGQDQLANMTVTKSKLMEFTPYGVNKGKAIMQIAELTGIATDQMMAFGDADNDVEMLQTVKYGFAMEDASDRLRAAAYEMVGSNEQDGVAVKLEEIFG